MSEEIVELFERTLSGDYDDDAPWDAVNTLRIHGAKQVFDIAAQWCESSDPCKRTRGADVLAQLGVSKSRPHAFPKESCDTLLRLLLNEVETRPIASAIFALGHIRDPRSLTTILRFATHASAEVRHGVAYALGSFADEPESVVCLLNLVNDADDDVRNWATFSLGALGNADSDDIRNALAMRLNDDFLDVRLEALEGLAKRKDLRALPALIDGLNDPAGAMWAVIEASYLMLGFEKEPDGWTRQDYIKALNERFGNAPRT